MHNWLVGTAEDAMNLHSWQKRENEKNRKKNKEHGYQIKKVNANKYELYKDGELLHTVESRWQDIEKGQGQVYLDGEMTGAHYFKNEERDTMLPTILQNKVDDLIDQDKQAAAKEEGEAPTVVDRTPKPVEQKPADPARQNLARMYDVLQLAKQYADQDKTSPEEFMRDRDLLNLFNAESVDDLTNAQKHELYKIFMGSTQQLESMMKAIEQALRSTGEIKSALRGELLKARDERKQVNERPRVRVRINSDTGELEHVSTTGDTEEQRTERGNYVQQMLQWRPATDGMTSQQVKRKYLEMGLPVEGVDFTRPSAKLAISMQEMRALINEGVERFGKDFADVVREILAMPSLTFETRNALVTRLLEMKPFSIDTMQKLIRMDAKLAAQWSNAGLMRRYERELNEEMADELFSAFGETGGQIKEAGQLVDSAINADIGEREQELYEQGLSEEEADRQTEAILNEKPVQDQKTTSETLGDLKNRTRANIALMKQRHSINEDRADQAVKSLVDAVKNKLKKIKC